MGKEQEDELSEDLPEGICPKEYSCGKDEYRGCPDPRKIDPTYCTVLQDWPELRLKSLSDKN
jgi:hypothetical protein